MYKNQIFSRKFVIQLRIFDQNKNSTNWFDSIYYNKTGVYCLTSSLVCLHNNSFMAWAWHEYDWIKKHALWRRVFPRKREQHVRASRVPIAHAWERSAPSCAAARRRLFQQHSFLFSKSIIEDDYGTFQKKKKKL